jgi:hypothetical protein|tara:strand:- start:484 stop:684 length:201 start_codon:yes stop_codon:yes gene_type:complete
MFIPCPKNNNKSCAFAGLYNMQLCCGVIGGSLESAKVSNMIKCPLKMNKQEIKKHNDRYRKESWKS